MQFGCQWLLQCRSGQISILITLASLIVANWYDEIPVVLLATLIAVSLSKPQLAIFTLPGFMVYRIKNYGVQKAAQLILYLICSILILTVPLFLAYPNWIPDFISDFQQNPS